MIAQFISCKVPDGNLRALESVIRHSNHAVNNANLVRRVRLADMQTSAVNADTLVLCADNRIDRRVQRTVHELGNLRSLIRRLIVGILRRVKTAA